MKRKSTSPSAFFNLRVLIGLVLCLAGISLALLAFGVFSGTRVLAQGSKLDPQQRGLQVGSSYHNDVSPAMRDLPDSTSADVRQQGEHEANENPKVPYRHRDGFDPVVQSRHASALQMLAPNLPAPILNFDGIPFPGVGCNCAPPDTNGAVGRPNTFKSSTKAIRSLTRARALRSWDLIASLPSGLALAVSAKPAGTAIQSCSMITWPTAGLSASSLA